ncbi:MAG: hypothetical protein K0S24_2583 [Sphingobacterium sp.]|jgi:hypothetical protein|nr:hypothetical protein [Sphingobacterium sp.]
MATFKEEVYYDGMVKIAVRNSTPQAKQEFNKDVNNEVASSYYPCQSAPAEGIIRSLEEVNYKTWSTNDTFQDQELTISKVFCNFCYRFGTMKPCDGKRE